MELKRGTVKWFDSEMRYGFMVNPDGGPDIFFHFQQGSQVAIDDRRFTYPHGVDFSYVRVTRDPEQGDVLVYQEGLNYKGKKAQVWAFADDWDHLAALIPSARWRVWQLRVVKAKNRLEPSLKIVWEDSEPAGLEAVLPGQRLPHYSETQYARTAWWCERYTERGWNECDEPREMMPSPGWYAQERLVRALREQYQTALANT